MSSSKISRRIKYKIKIADYQSAIKTASELFSTSKFNESFDIYEQILKNFPSKATEILSDVYDKYQKIPVRNRYNLYQSRIFDFKINTGDKIIDIGSGHMPFPYATHLADITFDNHSYGRAGAPFKNDNGKPSYEFNIELIPFEDKEFDFVYCSHVLEHTQNPERACEEIMRIGKSGYIETPTRAKDLWLNSAKISNHIWSVEYLNDILVFDEYEDSDLDGLETDLLMNMHVAPQSEREKAYSALIYLKPDMFNTMVYWEKRFKYKVIRKNNFPLKISTSAKPGNISADKTYLKFMQVHTFYPHYLDDFYKRYPIADNLPFNEERKMLLDDGFSAAHLLASELERIGYKSETIIANCMKMQIKWMKENRLVLKSDNNSFTDIVLKQVETIKPDILYITDPITFDSRFVRKLSYRPRLILGWRAASIPQGTDWSEFDLMLTSLSGLKEHALKLGAQSSELFYPGFPEWVLDHTKSVQPEFDISFVGQWTTDQHCNRNLYLSTIAEYARDGLFNPAYFLSGQVDTISDIVKNFDRGTRFGIEMHKALKSGKIAFDAQGDINIMINDKMVDLTNDETANMRIFEATGEGVFLLTEYHQNLKDIFEVGKEIETFSDKNELIDKINYYLDHDDERNEIALKGQQRCLTDHSLSQRVKQFDGIIRKHINDNKKTGISNTVLPSSPVIIEHKEMQTIVDEAALKLENENYDEAFKLLIKAKSFKIPFENLDTLRAAYFLQIKQIDAARESLYEELAHFPENNIAKKMLNQLSRFTAKNNTDNEFSEVLEKVRPFTMLSTERLFSLWTLAKRICEINIPGNFVECGVARGGSSALLSYVIKHYSKIPRKLFSFDTFEGMPEPSTADIHAGVMANDTGWGTGTCAAPIGSLLSICAELNTEKFVTPVRGLFNDTLPETKEQIKHIALMHMDGDWYASTKAILENLYDLLSPNSIIQVDDYGFWEGCRKAIDEFQDSRGIKFDFTRIDDTGVWFVKKDYHDKRETAAKSVDEKTKNLKLLNLGCGSRYHNEWTNIDFASNNGNVTSYNLRNGIPFENNIFNAVYHSHLLEHFPKDEALYFIKECYRVLLPEGIIRVAVPDLEQIAIQYLSSLNGAVSGDQEAENKYQWIMMEMYDQAVRNYSGGEMLKYWKLNPMPAENYVIERLGAEVKNFIDAVRIQPGSNNKISTLDLTAEQIGSFRLSGEIHQWMYDRFSLSKLLTEAGFNKVKVCKANESAIPNFNKYLLDIEPDGSVRKPDSLFMEGIK